MKDIKVELALKINKLIHDECENAPHDIGYRVSQLIEKKLDSIQQNLRLALDLLYAKTDDDECVLDHNGYCQTHGWFYKETCANKRAREILKEYGYEI
jgi:hypothetical protein